jgi:hypothetical protein
MTAKKITPANPEARPATEADKGAETEPVDRKTAQIHYGRKTASGHFYGRKTAGMHGH